MFRDFDQSTFSLGLQAFRNSLYITPDNLSDSPNTDSDYSYYSVSSPYSKRLRNLSERSKTPVCLQNIISNINDIHDGFF